MAHSHKNKIDVSWVHQLAEAARAQAEEPPEGFLTAQQIADETGITYSHVRRLIRENVKQGTIEVRKFRIEAGDRLYPVKHYRPIKGKLKLP